MSYSGRLSRDMNVGNGAVPRNKGETDVQLLVACKTQLSSEVIRLKTESLRLQKERDAAQTQLKELNQIVGKYSERERELVNRLCVAEDQNKRLRNKALGPSNIDAFQKLPLTLDKYHSYPWSDTLPKPSAVPNSCLNTLEMKKSPILQEDWKEVSQQLLEKMKQEMKEIAEFNMNFSVQENNKDQVKEVVQEMSNSKLSTEEIEESLSSLISDYQSLKHCLLQQNRTLKLLINNITQGNVQLRTEEVSHDESKFMRTSQTNMEHSVKPKPSTSQYSRHSDDSVRAFFTKHLEGCQNNLSKMNKTMQLFIQSDSQKGSDLSRSASKVTSPRLTKSQTETNKQTPNRRNTEEDRVCPICQASFHDSVPQDEFERHVVDHLEVESASLLDQYVVV